LLFAASFASSSETPACTSAFWNAARSKNGCAFPVFTSKRCHSMTSPF
jgi:hypothetical protein